MREKFSSMKIAVVAAGGRSGRALVTEALKTDYKVRAGVRSNSFFEPNKNLTIVKCDANNKQDVVKLINGCDAVISLIGHVKGSTTDIQTRAAELLVEAMREQKISRLISLTGTGVRTPGDKITLLDRLLNLGVLVIDPARVKDGNNHFEIIKNSGLDWTVIRVLKLQNTKPKRYRLSVNGPSKLVVSRGEVAKAIMKLLKTNKYIRQSPIISKY